MPTGREREATAVGDVVVVEDQRDDRRGRPEAHRLLEPVRVREHIKSHSELRNSRDSSRQISRGRKHRTRAQHEPQQDEYIAR